MTARIVVDAMGGDNAPGEILAGALMAAGGLGVELILVGRKAAIEAELEGAQAKNLKIIDAADVIEMDEHPTEAVKNKPESSINVGMRMVKSGQADAFVTAGNTGASMAAAMLTLGRIKGIGRPALATIFPTGEGRLTMLLDVGANADCRPIHLLQFAYMGAAYMERMFKVQNPKVGLLSIGEEDSKGNQLTVEVNQALRASRLNFMGNVEGKDLTRGVCDVAVMDGFTGNVVLKTAESVDVLISEATFTREHEQEAHDYAHMTAAQAAQIAVTAKARKLVLTHFSQRYTSTAGHVAEASAIFPEVVAAEDFARVPVPPRREESIS